MNEDELSKILGNVEEKVGKEVSATIADDLGTLITKNTEVINEMKSKDAQIKELKSMNAKLVASNGNLLQQIPMVDSDDSGAATTEETEPEKPFSMKACFDERGNFIQ